ncbi:THAP-type domain-containing protein [Aphis craccivora]|uniref:THAP-type domain-containing protein n=1 Tax=Aphis craccivora TaxID=307492 RepID=A0A6G0Y4Y0_APHCR|nr:THAP-type domain-containing protein [Aphis craccivora]
MSSDKCSFFNCTNTRRNTSNIIFHPFPSNEETCKIWIVNSGKKTFFNLGNIKLESLSPKKLKKKFICSSHFEKNSYSNPTAPKSRLNRNAVPNKYLYDNVPEKSTTIEKSPINWTWQVSNQNTVEGAYTQVNETLITTPTKSRCRRQKITDETLEGQYNLNL